MSFATRTPLASRVWPVAVLSAIALGATASPALATTPAGLLAAAVPTQANFGTIKGRLVWGGDKAPERVVLQKKGQAQKDPQVCAKAQDILSDELAVDPKTKGVQYGIAYVMGPKGENPEAVKALIAKEPKVELDQKNCTFLPHSLAMHQGQQIVFKSSDPTNHNIRYAAFNNGAMNQMLPPQGLLAKQFVAERRPIPVACDIHPWMKANIMVFDHPFFAVTGEDGSFEIRGVPPGAQNLVVWQEKTGYVTAGGAKGMPVEVKAGQTTDVGDIKLDPAKVR